MEALTISMIILICLRLILFKSSAAFSRSFKSSSKWRLFSSVGCLMCYNGVSGIGVSLPSYGSVMVGGVGLISGVALGGGIGVPATAVPCFSCFWLRSAPCLFPVLWGGMVSFPRCWVVPLGAWGPVEPACPVGEEGYGALFSPSLQIVCN